MGTRLLKGKVGRGGNNHGHDVKVVIELLNKHIQHGQISHLPLLSDHLAGNSPTVITAIESFQSNVLSFKSPDGVIDPGGKTVTALRNTPKDPAETLIAIGNIMLLLAKGPIGTVSEELWQAGLLSMLKHLGNRSLTNYNVITLVDFRKSIKDKRLWVIDLAGETAPVHTHVAHGQGSGGAGGIPTRFEDVSESHRSNLGGYVTLNQYKSKAGKLTKMGLSKYGPALIIDGLDSTNKKTKRRAIIFHGASYMDPPGGKFGRSWGCFATHPKDNEQIIKLIQNGTFVYSYAGDDKKP